MTCQAPDCHAMATMRAYATYNADSGNNIHPRHARYPMPMFYCCPRHIGEMCSGDTLSPGSTRQWLIVAPVLVETPEGAA